MKLFEDKRGKKVATDFFYYFLRKLDGVGGWSYINYTYREKELNGEYWIEVDIILTIDGIEFYFNNAQDYECDGEIEALNSIDIFEVDPKKFMFEFDNVLELVKSGVYDELKDMAANRSFNPSRPRL